MILLKPVDSNKNKLLDCRAVRSHRESRTAMTETAGRRGLRVDCLQGWVNSLNCPHNDLALFSSESD